MAIPPISCVKANTQHGSTRFPDHHCRPVIKDWRCELTALSRAYNLYFVASNESIYIYEPTFPSQDVCSCHSFVIDPPISSPDLNFQIDPEDPHSITRLHLDYLGKDEILIVTCDDGDAIGYRVPEIIRAMSRERTRIPEKEIDIRDEVRVFFHLNLGRSAWGISVHREARLIAFSANTHRITVFAYALSRTAGNVPQDELAQGFPYHRETDNIVYLQAQANIPAISFDNSDKSGRWLASSSIDGNIHVWDLHSPKQPARVITIGCCVSVRNPSIKPEICGCFNRTMVPHAAWASMFVDPRACRRAGTLQEACGPGMSAASQADGSPCFWDITEKGDRYKVVRVTPLSWSSPGPTMSPDDTYDEMSLPSSADSQESDEDDTHQPATQQHPGGSQSLLTSGLDATTEEHATLNDTSPVTSDVSPTIPNPAYDFSSDEEMDEADESEEELTFLMDATGQPSLNLNLFFPPAPDPVVAPEPTRHPYCTVSTSRPLTFSSPPITHTSGPLIIVTKEEIYLFQRPLDDLYSSHPRSCTDPILFMRNPLFPAVSPTSGGTPSRGHIPHSHRHSFATQIPELGVFVVGSPAGRVGIFRMTCTTSSRSKSPMYGFRLERILPTIEHENEDSDSEGQLTIADMWGKKLVGVSVGPIQGMQDGGDEDSDEDYNDERGMEENATKARQWMRRWRLFMHYNDHTVWSYELKEKPDGIPELGDLIV
ncbi:unnamed protein product [Periconia digitata]|uniref:Uncharacterized protein n=1 Tax=Periconia digitata TaxID=1303443 RepID=A0A9W4U7W1_9PLEO|nr:unnamed protein product [Periconia digitata]